MGPPADPPRFGPAAGGQDIAGPDDDTAPLPVILQDEVPDQTPQTARMRDPFEPIERPSTHLGLAAPEPATTAAPVGQAKLPIEAMTPGSAQMDQIKDLYLTAEAIGEDALSMHFQQVSERQRQLIREYFDHVAATTGEEQAQS